MSSLLTLVEHLMDAEDKALQCQAEAGDAATAIRYRIVAETLRGIVDPLLEELLATPPATDLAAYLRTPR